METLRRHGAFVLFLAGVGALYLWLNAFDDLGGLGGDGLIYFATARHYAPYWPPDPVAAEQAATTQFPPVYSLMLMATGGASSLLAAHLATTVFLLCALAAFYVWLCSIGLERRQAAFGMALFAVMPGTWVQSFYLHPEGLYVALVFAALTMLARAERRAHAGWWWAAAGAAGVAIVTRTVGITLLPALALALWRARPRLWPAMIALALLPEAVWAVLHRPPWGYSDTLVARYGGNPPIADVVAAILKSVVPTLQGLGANVVQTQRLLWPVAAAGALSLGVALWRFQRLRPDAWYLLAYLGVMLVWPFPEEARRLDWVVVPILLGYCLWAGQEAFERVEASSGRLRAAFVHAPALVLGLIVLPGFALLMARATHPLAYLHPAYRHTPEWYDPALPRARWLAEIRVATADGFRAFATLVPPGECVFTTRPLMTSFFMERTAYFTPPERKDDATFDEEVRAKGCRFFVLHRDVGREYTRAHYPLDRLGERLEIVALRRIDVGPDDDRLVTELAILKPEPPSP